MVKIVTFVKEPNANKALWEKGDFTKIAETMRESGEELVNSLGILPGMKVLDLGCGDGTTAIPAAKIGADVLGVDIASNLVEAGIIRAEAEKLYNCRFEEGDACNLFNLETHSFDFVVSIFGAMFAPNANDVANEMVRVTRPGGKIVMGNWIPGDPTLVAQVLKISAQFTPPPPAGFVSPILWGVEDVVTDRFVQAGIRKENISFEESTFKFRAPYSPLALLENFRNYYGPTMNAYEAAEKNGRSEELHNALSKLFDSQNTSGDHHTTIIPATFLKVTVVKE